jgi:hypothetical protein
MPITNIAFTLRIFMGDAAEPLSTVDLVGLVLVCIGFLTYSCFGLAENFMVAQVAYLSLLYCVVFYPAFAHATLLGWWFVSLVNLCSSIHHAYCI